MISFWLGLAAFVVLGLTVIRAVRRRTDFLLTVADVLVALGIEIETWSNRAWFRQVRNIPYNERYSLDANRLARWLDVTSQRVFSTAWRIEDAALGVNSYHPLGRPEIGLAAASYQDDEDDLLMAAERDYADGRYDYDDYRYDY